MLHVNFDCVFLFLLLFNLLILIVVSNSYSLFSKIDIKIRVKWFEGIIYVYYMQTLIDSLLIMEIMIFNGGFL